MDTSKEYIKMCEKAKGIQESWRPRTGDFIWKSKEYLPIKDACGYLPEADVFDTHGYKDKGYIFLPRQDQLQRLANKNKLTAYGMFVELYEWIMKYKLSKKGFEVTLEFIDWDSMEQLWLAFVMKELYQKNWNGEDWVK